MIKLRDYANHLLESEGWSAGTSLENRAALALRRYKIHPSDVKQQFKACGYRLDFAWPNIKVALEVDGPFHYTEEGALHDKRRDRCLQEDGWVVFRVHDHADDLTFDQAIVRVIRFVRAEME